MRVFSLDTFIQGQHGIKHLDWLKMLCVLFNKRVQKEQFFSHCPQLSVVVVETSQDPSYGRTSPQGLT